MIGRLCRALLALVLTIAVPAGADGTSRCAASDFRAMTCNIRLDTPADGPNRWELRRELLIGPTLREARTLAIEPPVGPVTTCNGWVVMP